MKKISAKMLQGAMAAEGALAREDILGLEEVADAIPDDHPLKKEIQEKRAKIGDLAGLPPGHPLLLILEEARQRFEAQRNQESQPEQKTQPNLRRVKRIDAQKARAAERVKEEDKSSKVREAAKLLNGSIRETMDAVVRLRQNSMAAQDDLASDRYAAMKLARLQRMLFVIERGLAESQINAGRIFNG